MADGGENSRVKEVEKGWLIRNKEGHKTTRKSHPIPDYEYKRKSQK
jgi:hypothetical protein